jgi:hypothetical protein
MTTPTDQTATVTELKPASTRKPASRASRGAAAAKADGAKATGRKPADKATTGRKPATKATAKPAAKAQKPAKPETTGWTPQAKRELFRAVIVAGGELVAKLPADVRAEAGQDLANQLHHLTRQNFGWPGKLPVPIRSDWTGYKP